MPINFDAMDEYNKQPEPAPEEKSILGNIWDTVTDAAELVVDTGRDVLNAVRDYNAAAGGRGDLTLEQATDNLKMAPFNRMGNAFVNKYADSDTPLLSGIADSIQSSELAYTQIIPDEKKWEQARKIQQEIGIPAETVMYDQTAWKNANNLYDEYQKAKEYSGQNLTAEDMQQINPIIQKVSTADPAAGALIMADAYNTSKELSIIDTFNEYFEMGKMEMELNELGEKYREQKHSQEDLKRIKELQGQINDFYNKHNINFIDDPLASIAAGVGQSAPITMESMYSALEDQAAWSASLAWAGGTAGAFFGPAGSATGAAVGGAGGLAVGFFKNLPKLAKTGMLLLKVNKGILARNFVGRQLANGAGRGFGSTIGGMRGMLDSEIGGKYIEYRDMKDENGNPLMDHEEASTRAVITGMGTSFLEVAPTVEILGRMTKGSKLYKQAVEEVFDAAGMKYTRKAIATDAAIDFTKNTFKGAFTESSEEMFQNITEDLMLNDIEATHNDKANGGVKPYTDIILDGMGAFVASYPTSLAFGVGGAAGSGIFSSSQYAVRKRNISRQEKMFGAELKNTAIGNALAADLQDAVHNSKLVQSAPDVQKQIIHDKAAGTGFENVYIDVEMALEKENGKEDLRAVAKAANISDEELDIAIEEKGTLSVPLECFAQSESSQELLESASYNAETKSIARMKKEAKSTMESIKKAYDENLAQQERIINTIITELFPAEENDKVSVARQDMAKSIIMTFSENPAMGWREMMKLVQDERMEIIGGALKYLQETSGNGVSIIPTEDGKGVRASNNAQWYSDWYSEHGRKPTKAELEDIAEDMMRGKKSIGDYHNIPEEELQATNAALDEINGKIKALEEIKDKMLGLTGVEMKLTEGLSKEAYAGYRQIMDQLQHAPAKAVRAARMNAILLARHADLYAKIMQKKGNTNYTAKDYMDSVGLRFGGQNLGGFNQMAGVRAKTAALDKLEKAKAMEAEDKLSDDIYKETGWLKGKDDKWRFEIPDELDAIKADEFIAEGEDAVWTLGQLYKNEKLYEAYPFLENVKVRLSLELARNVNGSVRGAEIEINYKDGKVTADGLKKTLVHEIQHVIQDKEGFASGGNMDSVRIQVEAELSRLRRKLETGLIVRENSAVDLDKLLDQRSDLIGKSNEAVFDGDIDTANAIQDDVKAVEEKIQELLPNRNLEEVFETDGQIRYLEKRMKDYYKASPEEKESILYEMYQDLAGEQEARNTTFRALMLNDKKNEALKADKEAGSLGLAFEKEYKNATEEIRELADEHSKLSAEYEQLEGEAKKDSFQRMEAIEKQLNETEQGAKLLSAMEERWFAEWEKEEAWDRVREFSGSNPHPHSYDAIVVYGGESFSVENQQKKSFDLSDRKAVEKFLDDLTYEDLPTIKIDEELNDFFNKHSNEDIYEWAKEKVNNLLNKKIIDVFGNERYLGPGEYETVDKYAMHLIAGKKVKMDDVHVRRAMALSLIEKTLQDPIIVYTQNYRDEKDNIIPGRPGRKVYVSFYQTKTAYFNYAIVEVEEKENGRIVTSFASYDRKGHKKEALRDFRKNVNASYSVDYIRLGLSGYSRPAVREHASSGNIPLHSSGNFIIAQNTQNGKTHKYDLSNNNSPLVSQKEEVRKKYEGTDQWMKAPNGKPTKLTKEQWLAVRTPAFKKWFGDWENDSENASKVVDENGEPLVVYHGTNTDFDIFDKSTWGKYDNGTKFDYANGKPIPIKDNMFFFTSDENLAEKHAEGSVELSGNGKARVIPCFISSQKTLVEFVDDWYATRKFYDTQLYYDKNTADFQKKIRDGKYDTLVLRNPIDGNDILVGVTESTQIKSATDNKGEYDVNNPNIYYQGIQGSLTPMADGQRIITLFESADESTFLHEMGHLFLLDLENLAKVDEQSAKELAEVTKWAVYKKSDVKGYKGSPFEGEFLKLAADIEAAEKAGDVSTADQLKRRWMHERFARGFEMYLEFGEAPSKGLKAVFRKFKQFLKVLYFGFAGQGVRATPKVEKIMARMIASDNEIEAMALDSRYKDITKAGGEKLLGETEAQTMQRWHEEAKEEAKEKLMAIIMKDLSEEKKRERQAKINKEREEVTTFMTSMPVYIAQKVIAETGSKDAVVEMGIYSSIEQLESDLEAVKDIPLDKAIEDHMADYEADLDKKQMDEEMTEEKLSKIMNQTYYHNKLLALETAALQERTRTMQRINSKAKNAIHEANVAIDGLDDDVEIKLEKNSPKVKAVLRALAKLRYADRWGTEDLQAIDKIINSSTKSEIAAALKEFETNSNQWKKNLKVLQEAFDGQHRIIENAAKADLDKKKLIDACSYRHYVSMEKNASNLMNMFVRQGKWEAALRQQQFRLQAAAMAKYAKKNQEKLKKLTDKVTKQLSARTVKVAKDERYWHRHLAYLLGLNKEAPVKPQELLSAAELFEGLNASLDIKDDEFKQQLYTIYEKISAQDFGGYMTLTMAELEDAVDMLTVLYTTGRDKFRMKSFDGKMLHEVVDEICWDPTGISVMTQNRYINPDTGGLGYNDILAKVPFIGENLSRVGQKYINAHIKPEELLKLIGDKAHKYIYGLYERAANDEGKMTAESVLKLKDILSVYSHAEKREWKKQKYTLETGAGTEKVSKENIICMALNRGNETNWHRLFRGLRVDPAELAHFIDENMTEKDWDTVQALWDHIGSYWDQTVKVEEKLNGVTLKSVEPREFIVNLPDGQQKTIRGGYYPIAYNPEKSIRAEEQSVDKAAQRSMKGAQVLGAGRGFTKGRSESLNIERPLRLSFDVIPNHLGDVIHNITYRITARDVYRLVTSQKFEYLIRDTLGAEALRSITDWAVDCWKIMPNNTSQAEGAMNKLFGYFRRNATFNIMGYRMWPVIENSTNIFPMMDRLGVVNALSAIGDYYAHKKECDLMMLKSSFMTNRINSMDRDIKTMPGLFDEDMKGLGWMKQHAYSMMVYSDLMLSAPLWARAYKDSIAGHYVDVERENKEMVEALRAAQAKVDDLNAQMFDLKKEKQHILDQLHPGYEVEYSPQRMRAVGYLNSELARIKSQLEPMEKELWEAEKELDKLANVDLMLPDDILKEAEVRAVQTADGAVRNVFGSGHTKDLAPIQKGGEFAKMFTCFYSFFNTQANAILANYYKGKFAKEELTGLQNIAVWMPFAKSVLFRIFLTSALSTIMKMAFGLDGDDDKDKYRKVMNEDGTETKEEIPSLERFLTQYAKNTVSTASGTMVGVRDVASLVCTYLFDGYDMGGSKAGSVPTAFIDKAYSTFKLANKKEERDAKIAADEERRKARYEKMSPKQKKKFDEELQYRHPAKRITYADIAKSGVGTVTSVTAAQTGITDTMANTVMTTMQYMADGDGRYDPSLSNIMWSAFWNKKPVEREIPEKPVKPKKKNKKGA